jgi:hypothetical protein
MNLGKVLFITGKSGLFQLITQTKSGAIIESFADGKRFPVFSNNKISILEDISIYTKEKDVPLKKVLQEIFKKENGGKTIEATSNESEIRNYMKEVLPDYDEEQVHLSDIKRILSWYNILLKKQMINLEEETDEKEEA